jgi:hypothetical protein
VVLCGICRGPNGPWAAVALAAHPSSFARHAVVAPAAAEPSTRLMPLGRRLDRPSRRGRIGRAAAATRAPVAGTARGWRGVLGGVCLRLDGARAYMEKNWGPGFAAHRWWGHTDPSAKRPEAPGSLEKAARHPVATAHAPVPPTPGGGRGIRLRGDLGGAHRRKRRQRGACQGRRPAPRRLGGRHNLPRAPGGTQGRRDQRCHKRSGPASPRFRRRSVWPAGRGRRPVGAL